LQKKCNRIAMVWNRQHAYSYARSLDQEESARKTAFTLPLAYNIFITTFCFQEYQDYEHFRV